VLSPRRSNILRDLQVVDKVNADEAWLVTTPYGLAPVTKIDGVPIGDGKPCTMWRTPIDAWSRIAGKDVYREMAEAKE